MTKERAIEILKSVISWESEFAEAKEMAIEALEQTRWIPCSERLPERWEWSLVAIQSLQNGSYVDMGFLNSKMGWSSGFEVEFENVVAWMPLPQPYKEGES